MQKERQRIREENLRLQEHLNNALIVQEKLKQKATIMHNQLPINHQFLAPPSTPHFPPQINPHIKPQFTSPNRFTGPFAEPPTQITNHIIQPPKVSGPFAEPPVQYMQPSGQFAEPPIKIPQSQAGVVVAVPNGFMGPHSTEAPVTNNPSKTAQLAISKY